MVLRLSGGVAFGPLIARGRRFHRQPSTLAHPRFRRLQPSPATLYAGEREHDKVETLVTDASADRAGRPCVGSRPGHQRRRERSRRRERDASRGRRYGGHQRDRGGSAGRGDGRRGGTGWPRPTASHPGTRRTSRSSTDAPQNKRTGGSAGGPGSRTEAGRSRVGRRGRPAAGSFRHADPGGVPHYFGPYGNWAFSPLPKGTRIGAVTVDGRRHRIHRSRRHHRTTLTTRRGSTPPLRRCPGVLHWVTSLGRGMITAITLNRRSGGSGGAGYIAPVVTITDPIGTGRASATRSSAARSAAACPSSWTRCRAWGQRGERCHSDSLRASTSRLAFPSRARISGQAADCYSIALVEYSEKMSSDLPATKLRGYVQLSTTGTIDAEQPAMAVRSRCLLA